MKFERVFWGLLIILTGVLILGSNLGWWNSNIWLSIIKFWPVIFILIGVRLIFGEESPIPILVLLIATLGIGVYLVNYEKTQTKGISSENFSTVLNHDSDFDSSLNKITLEISAGASSIMINKY